MSPVATTARARLLKVQEEVNTLFTEVHDSGVTGRNVAEALASIREVLKAVEFAIFRTGRI